MSDCRLCTDKSSEEGDPIEIAEQLADYSHFPDTVELEICIGCLRLVLHWVEE